MSEVDVIPVASVLVLMSVLELDVVFVLFCRRLNRKFLSFLSLLICQLTRIQFGSVQVLTVCDLTLNINLFTSNWSNGTPSGVIELVAQLVLVLELVPIQC